MLVNLYPGSISPSALVVGNLVYPITNPSTQTMRFNLLLLFSFISTSFLVGQNELLGESKSNYAPLDRAWQFSLTASPTISRSTYGTILVLANDTLVRATTSPNSTWIRTRVADTILLAGDEVPLYYRNFNTGEVELADPEISLRFSLKAHYRFTNNFEFAAGFNYLSYHSTRTIKLTNNLPNEFFYLTADRRTRSMGLVTSFSYHFFKYSRLQPYAGIRSFWNISQVNIENTRIVSPFSDVEFNRPTPDKLQENSFFAFDLDVILGMSYRIGERVSIGIEGGSGTSNWAFFGDLQLRYCLSSKHL